MTEHTHTTGFGLTSQFERHLQCLEDICSDQTDILDRLNATIAYSVKFSGFYRNRFPEPVKLETIDELSQLPFTTKEDIKQSYPFGLLATSKKNLLRYGESTGTSGKYSSGFVSRRDWLRNNVEVVGYWSTFLNASDVMAIAVPYELSYVGADIDRVAEMLGVSVLSVGANNRLCPWTRLIHLIESYSITTLFCSPTRAIRLAQLAEESGYNPRQMSVTKIICVGESCSEAKTRYIEACWGARVFIHYGMTETLAVAMPCANQNLHLTDSRLYAEIIDPVTGQAGASVGELVLTSLDCEAMPLIRYRTGDMVSVEKGCDCASSGKVIQHLGRTTDVFWTPAGLAFFHELDEVLFQIKGIMPYFGYEYIDERLYIKVALAEGGNEEKSIREIIDGVESKFAVQPIVNVVTASHWLIEIDNRSKPGNTLVSSKN